MARRQYGMTIEPEQCHAVVTRSNRKGEPTRRGKRCKFITLRGIYCHQHERQLRHFRIKLSTMGPGYGLFTTVDIPAGRMIVAYGGDTIQTTDPHTDNPYWLQIKKRPETWIDGSVSNIKDEGRYVKPCRLPGCENNAEIVVQGNKAYLYSTQKISAGQEITAAHKVAEAPKPKRVLRKLKDVHPEQVKRTIPRPRQPVPAPIRQQRADNRWEKQLIHRLKTIQLMFKDQKLANTFALRYNPNKTITIPAKGDDYDPIDYRRQLETKVKSQEKALLAYFKTNPNNTQITLAKLRDTVDKFAAKYKNKI